MNKIKEVLVMLVLAGASLSAKAQFPPVGMSGSGTSSSPWEIATPAHLKALADWVNAGNGEATMGKYFKLVSDIDLSGYASGDGWEPIGTYISGTDSSKAFQGVFDGNNHRVVNLTIDRDTVSYIGLFGTVWRGIIQDLGVTNCNVTGRYYVSGLIGIAYISSTINGCYATGSVSGGIYVGGLVGRNYISSSITNCYTTGNVSGGGYVGGLVGRSDSLSMITNCHSTSDINATAGYVGGLVGTAYRATITNCYATGEVNGQGPIGGLVGWISGNLQNSYATGNVNGVDYTGGLVGASMEAAISNCYASGSVKGTGSLIGGIIGRLQENSTMQNCVAANDSVKGGVNYPTSINRLMGNYTTGSTYSNNYVLRDMVVSSGTTILNRSDNDLNGTGKSIDTLQSLEFYNTAGNWYNNTAWDINSPSSVWDICDGEEELPFLRWQGIDCDGVGIVGTRHALPLQVYPNPTSGMLQVTSYEGGKIEIYDVVGQCVFTTPSFGHPSKGGESSTSAQFPSFGGAGVVIDVSHLASGMYFLKVDNKVVKFVKE